MGRPPKSETIDQRIDRLWTSEVKRTYGTKGKPAAVRVWRVLHGNEWVDPSKSKQIVSRSYVEKRIQKIDPRGRSTPNARIEGWNEPWQPWLNTRESPEDTAFLMRLNAAKRSIYGGMLVQDEADWGHRLRPSVEDLDPYRQYSLVAMYAEREFTRIYLGREQAYTGDLDGLIAYRAWAPESQETYELAVALGLVPFPFFSTFVPYASTVDRSFKEIRFPFLAHIAERPGDFPGWSGMIVDLLAPQGEAFFGDTLDKLDPHFIQRKDRFLKFWAGIQETAESTQEEGVSDEREHS